MYQVVLSGGTGFMFGMFPMWQFWAPGYPAWYLDGGGYPGGWKTALDSPGTKSATLAGQFLRQLPWYSFKPDTSHVVMTSGYGTYGSDSYALIASTYDGRIAVAYFTAHLTVTIDMSTMSGTTQARWFDPSSGSYTTVKGGPFLNKGSQNFTPPGNNAQGLPDWLLLLQAN
jgi:hypothetical protein